MPRFRLLILFCCFNALLFAPPAVSDGAPPPLLLANVYAEPQDLAAYWVSEKLDGVRAYWNGEQLISRQGNPFQAPAWFTRGFPQTPLDGELWMGRGSFETLSGTVRQLQPDPVLWQKVRFMVFDLPASEQIFDQRLEQLKTLLNSSDSPYIQAVSQFKVTDQAQLTRQLRQVVKQGGEGLMLHRGDSLYRRGRSDTLLKLKTYEDAEAVVIDHLPGKGKYVGMLGALLVETPQGLRFRIGTGFSDAERAAPPPVGSTVTYKYYGKTRFGTPRFASFLRLRNDRIDSR